MAHSSQSSRNKSFTVSSENTLLNFLFESLKNESKTTVKSLLSHKQISINGKAVTQFDAPLKKGDKIDVFFDRKSIPFSHPLLKIIYEDRYLIVIEKASGLLSMASENEKENTVYRILNNYLGQTDRNGHIFILHRLDRDTSGIMMFAKNQQVQETLQRNWNEMISERKYVAVIEGQLPQENGTIRSYITENSSFYMHSTTASQGKLAITHYHTLKAGASYSLIELELETGRKNQIRLHMQEAGHPIAGDKKYGAKTNPLHRLGLLAYRLRFIHPVTHQELDFKTPIPASFQKITK